MTHPSSWTPVLMNIESLQPRQWLDLSIVALYLNYRWYQSSANARVRFMDVAAAGSWATEEETEQVFEMYTLPSFRRRYLLPVVGPCPLVPVLYPIFFNDSHHFHAVLHDPRDKHIYLLGAMGLPAHDPAAVKHQWLALRGDRFYQGVCRLYGWPVHPESELSFAHISPQQNGYDCGIVIIQLAVFLFENGIEAVTTASGVLTPTLDCGHLARYDIYHQLRLDLRNVMLEYSATRTMPPPEWEVWDRTPPPEFDPLEAPAREALQRFSLDTDPMLGALLRDARACRTCRTDLRHRERRAPQLMISAMDAHAIELEERGLDPISDAEEDVSESPDIARAVSPSEGPVDGPPDKMVGKERRLRVQPVLSDSDWSQLDAFRFPRPTEPGKLPDPTPPFWPAHSNLFDDYFGGPTQEDMVLYEQPVNVFPGNPYAELPIRSEHRDWRDYGYRILARFAHLFYLCSAIQVRLFHCRVRAGYSDGGYGSLHSMSWL